MECRGGLGGPNPKAIRTSHQVLARFRALYES